MSVNTVSITSNREPVPVSGEQFVSVEENVEFEIQSGTGYPGSSGNFYSSKTRVFMSNLRIVVIPIRPSRQFTSLSIPLYNVCDQKLRVPLFGRSSVRASVIAIANLGIISQGKMSIFFPTKRTASGFKEALDEAWENADRTRMMGGPDALGHSLVCNPPQAPPMREMSQQQMLAQTFSPSRQQQEIDSVSQHHVSENIAQYKPPEPLQYPSEPRVSSAYIDSNDSSTIFLPVSVASRPSHTELTHDTSSTSALPPTSNSSSRSIPSESLVNAPLLSAAEICEQQRERVPNIGGGMSSPLLQSSSNAEAIEWPSLDFTHESNRARSHNGRRRKTNENETLFG